jgi:hypothetical protein
MKVLSLTEMSADLKVLNGPVTGMEYFALGMGEDVFRGVVEHLFFVSLFIHFRDFHEFMLRVFPFVFGFGLEAE